MIQNPRVDLPVHCSFAERPVEGDGRTVRSKDKAGSNRFPARNRKVDYRPGPFKHPSLGEYYLYCWCGQCQRVNLTWRWVDNGWTCPSEECNGVARDAWRWEEVRRVEPEFPKHPIVGRVYKLHAFDWEIAAQTSDDDSDAAA